MQRSLRSNTSGADVATSLQVLRGLLDDIHATEEAFREGWRALRRAYSRTSNDEDHEPNFSIWVFSQFRDNPDGLDKILRAVCEDQEAALSKPRIIALDRQATQVDERSQQWQVGP